MCRPGDKIAFDLFIRVLPTAIPIPPFHIRALPVAIRVLECVIRTLPVVIRALERAIRTLPGSISIPSPLIRILAVVIRLQATGKQAFSGVIRAKTPTCGHCRSHTDCADTRTDICDKEKGHAAACPCIICLKPSSYPQGIICCALRRIHFAKGHILYRGGVQRSEPVSGAPKRREDRPPLREAKRQPSAISLQLRRQPYGYACIEN